MTGKELIDQVCLLGARTTDEFEQDFQSEHIYSSINRAISEVNRLFPVIKTVQLLHYPRRPAVYIRGITVHKGGEDTVFKASDIKSLAFAVSGTGSATLEGEGSTATHTFSWQDQMQLTVFKAIISDVLEGYNGGILTLTFKGEYSYMISDVSFYDELEDDMVDDVDVYSPWTAYDLGTGRYAVGDFLDFASLPVRNRNVDLNSPYDYHIDGKIVYLPRQKEGVYEVRYYKAPGKVSEHTLDGELEIDFRLHDLIPYRAAYHIYAILDPEAAKVCDTEYQKLLSVILSTMPKIKTPRKFRDVRGW
jgi:hypothetical protein